MVLLMSSLALAVEADDLRRPPPLAPKSRCDLWRGEASGGNDSVDATVEITVQICPDGERLTGTLQWSSLVSGWGKYTLAGLQDSAQVKLWDVEKVEIRPKPGWRFCDDTQYRFRREGSNRLVGGYVSKDCDDTGDMVLVREGTAPAGASGEPSEPPAPPPDDPPPEIGCAVSGGGGGLLLALLAMLGSGRRRPD